MARGIKKVKWDGTQHKPLIYPNTLQGPAPSVLKAILCAASVSCHPSSGTSVGCLCEEQQWSQLCYLPEGSSRDAAVSLMS